MPPVRTSRRIDPAVAASARRGDVSDGDTYHRPATDRIAPANVALSICAILVSVMLATLLLLIAF